MTATTLLVPAYAALAVLAWTEGARATLLGLAAFLALMIAAGKEAGRGR